MQPPIKPSIQSRFMAHIMSIIGMKRRTNAISTLREHPIAIMPAKPPRSYYRKHDISVRQINGRNVWMLSPKNSASSDTTLDTRSSPKAVLYLHGGAYVYSFIGSHWQFISKIVTATNRTVIAPDYPLAPASTVQDIFAMMLPLYREFIEQFGAGNLAVMGDSAGGGMTLSLAQIIRDEGLPQPEQLILLSPWLDASMSNDALSALDKRDPILGIQGLRDAGLMYAGDLSTKDTRVSPMFGDCSNLAPISLFIGTRDMFLADCREFYAKLTAQGIRVAYHEAAEMLHDWMLMPMPEAEEVVKEIQKLLA